MHLPTPVLVGGQGRAGSQSALREREEGLRSCSHHRLPTSRAGGKRPWQTPLPPMVQTLCVQWRPLSRVSGEKGFASQTWLVGLCREGCFSSCAPCPEPVPSSPGAPKDTQSHQDPRDTGPSRSGVCFLPLVIFISGPHLFTCVTCSGLEWQPQAQLVGTEEINLSINSLVAVVGVFAQQ